jgi:hypothetical protein
MDTVAAQLIVAAEAIVVEQQGASVVVLSAADRLAVGSVADLLVVDSTEGRLAAAFMAVAVDTLVAAVDMLAVADMAVVDTGNPQQME